MLREAGEREVLSLPEAAAFLGIEERTMRRWLTERGVPHAKVGGLLRFRRAALLRWLRARECETMARRQGRQGAGDV
jgi:excisionase family DNA binding protein